MALAVEFRLLGPVAVRCDGLEVPLRRAKERTLLAALLLNAGRTLSAAMLMEVLWGAELPRSAPAGLQVHMMRLRRSLGDEVRSRISTRPHGYEMAVAPAELDVVRAEELLRAGLTAVSDHNWSRAAELSATALAEWRGEPLADVSSELLALQEVPRLSEIRLQLWEMRSEAELMLGRHAELIGELQRLTSAYPLREHLCAQLIRALCYCGRQADAVACYQHIRRVLISELGVEPGTELASLNRQILGGAAFRAKGAAITVSTRVAGRLAGDGATALVPRQLPCAARRFTGRQDELAALSGLLDQLGAETPGTAVISAIDGTAGVGKTALAVQWSHRVATNFPDGQLYVDLYGYDQHQPMMPGDVLSGFLRALGVADRDIPFDVGERAALYRSLVSGRRMLVFLDNARDAWQVRPLLPGCATCLTLVTSRDALASLVARDGAQRLDVDLLPLTDAVHLLCLLIGDRATADPDAACALAEACCRLPLALRVAAELAAVRPASTLRDLGSELTWRCRSGAEADPVSDVRAVFSWSYRRLTGAGARAFRLAGLAPVRRLDEHVLAALLDVAPERARLLLDELARAHLIQPAGRGRYTMHDLLRGYACDLALAYEAVTGRRAALTRLSDRTSRIPRWPSSTRRGGQAGSRGAGG